MRLGDLRGQLAPTKSKLTKPSQLRQPNFKTMVIYVIGLDQGLDQNEKVGRQWTMLAPPAPPWPGGKSSMCPFTNQVWIQVTLSQLYIIG